MLTRKFIVVNHLGYKTKIIYNMPELIDSTIELTIIPKARNTGKSGWFSYIRTYVANSITITQKHNKPHTPTHTYSYMNTDVYVTYIQFLSVLVIDIINSVNIFC